MRGLIVHAPEPDPTQPAASTGAASCTIVVPCYNEALRLDTEAFRSYLRTVDFIRFLFVNDGSTDATLAVLESLRAGLESRIEILHQAKNAGKGEAVRKGLLLACQQPGTTCVGFWDADLATPLESIPLLLDELERNPQIQMVFGSRIRLLGRHVHRKASRHYLGRVFATVVSTMLRLPIYDTQCGAKIFRNTPELAALLTQPFISPWVFDVEIIARFKAVHHADPDYLNHSIYELPLPRWQDVTGSKVRPGHFFQAFLDVLRIYRRYLS